MVHMSLGVAVMPPLYQMGRTRKLVAAGDRGQKKEKENRDRKKEIGFTDSEWEQIQRKLSPTEALATVIQNLTVDWANGNITPSGDMEAYRNLILSQVGVDDVTLPDLGAVVCGPLKEAVAEADEFTLSDDVSTFLKIQEEDWAFDAEGQSMEGAGIPEGAKVFLRPHGERWRPSRGDIVLVEVSREDEEPTYTLKRFRKSQPFEVEDGDGELYPLPEDANKKAVAELVAYMVSK
ncbi:hypothetical protein IAD21_00952 [Abditibacteriota bacterium]|nr:hypothetical protein IAD21_00952 [Abditibacteriota bacterium]